MRHSLIFFCFLLLNLTFGQSDIQKYCVEKSTDFKGILSDAIVEPTIVYLKAPSEITEEDINNYKLADNQPGVFVGGMPENFNGTVLVIHPGATTKFLANNIIDSNIYNFFYTRGYAVAFLATSAFLGDFYNGYITSLGIDIVSNHFGVDKVSLAGVSSGVSPLDVAVICHDKIDKVDKVFAIGGTYFGTELVDFGLIFPEFMQIVGSFMFGVFNGIGGTSPTINQIGENNFYYQSTFYKKNVFRPFMDSHPNNKPEIFYTAGSSKFFDFSYQDNLMNNMAVAVTGSLLSVLSITNEDAEIGKNDGVTSLYSTRRPGNILFDEFADVNTHHMNYANALYSFTQETLHNLITKAKNEGSVTSFRTLNRNRKELLKNNSRNIVTKSNYQLSKIGGLKLDKNSNEIDAKVLVVNKNTIDTLNAIVNNFQNTKSTTNSNFRLDKNGFDRIVNDVIFKEYKNYINEKNNLRISNQKNTNNSESIEFLIQKDISLELTVDYSQSVYNANQNPYPILVLDVISDKAIEMKTLEITAEATQHSNLSENNPLLEKKTKKLNFVYNPTRDLFEASTTDHEFGFYTLKLRAKNNDFQRDVVTGYTVGGLFESIDLDKEQQGVSKNSLFIDTDKNKIFFNSKDEITENRAMNFKFYSINGKFLGEISTDVKPKSNGKIVLEYGKQLLLLKGNFYFVTVETNNKKESFKVLAR